MQIRWEAQPHPDDVATLEQGVAESMRTDPGHGEPQDLAGFVRDEDDHGAIRGGVYGWTWGGCCELQYLWVDEALRQTGVGGRLLEGAEAEARSRGCNQVVLFTHASQAPTLYPRHGYELIGRVDDYPVGDAALWFRKVLLPEALSSGR